MSFLNTISRCASDYQARRRRLRTYQEITSLPREIQKDIGWPDAYLTDHSGLAHTGNRPR